MRQHNNHSLELSGTPLTDELLQNIATRLNWYGAKAAAARYAGLSRQNFGKLLRERGVPRDSEILLRLDEFSRMPPAEQQQIAGKNEPAADSLPPQPENGSGASDDLPTADNYTDTELPTWML